MYGKSCFRPLIRGFFFYSPQMNYIKRRSKKCFRPLIRGFFFYAFWCKAIRNMHGRGFRPLIRGFFFYEENRMFKVENIESFRPLIRGFFFYKLPIMRICISAKLTFPSPHSGILFLLHGTNVHNGLEENVSVPSFGDSFFIRYRLDHLSLPRLRRFRPLIRGFFFYTMDRICMKYWMGFPSPHSGILFL